MKEVKKVKKPIFESEEEAREFFKGFDDQGRELWWIELMVTNSKENGYIKLSELDQLRKTYYYEATAKRLFLLDYEHWSLEDKLIHRLKEKIKELEK